MITVKMAKALNEQINKELYSAYLYLAMSADAQNKGMPGVANWFYVQTQEELGHVQRFYQYLLRQNAVVELDAIAKPEVKAQTALDLFKAGLAHEKFITASIHSLVDVAVEQKDRATEVFLQWFVNEQVEEEENACGIIDQLKLAGDVGSGLFMIDRELATRVYNPAPAAE
ncbi:MAG: ferritin [Kiritimatiellia bacterium]